VSRHANIGNLDVSTINQKTIQQLVKEATHENTEIQNLKREVETIRKELSEIKKNSGPIGYNAGRAVTVTVHFEDIDVNSANFDVVQFQEDLSVAFSIASGVSQDNVILICIRENNGSTMVEIETHYHFHSDPLVQTPILDNLSNFVHMLNSGEIYTLNQFGEYNIVSFSVGNIQGMNCKISKIINKFSKSEISFEDSDTLLLGDYRLKIKNKQLFIQRYDHFIGEYVGGTVVTD